MAANIMGIVTSHGFASHIDVPNLNVLDAELEAIEAKRKRAE